MIDSNNTKHVALFMPSLEGGGAERVMLSLAEGFAEKGVKVDLVLNRAVGAFVQDVPPSIRVIELGASRIFTSIPKLVKYLQREKPDALLSALTGCNIVAVVSRFLARSKTRIVVSEHNARSTSAKHLKSYRELVYPPLMRLSYKRADGIVAVSDGVADDLRMNIGIKGQDVKVIYNPVVTRQLLLKANEPVNHPWIGKDQPPLFIAVGRLMHQKDFPNLIRAFKRLREQKNCRLLILGEGPDRASLETLIKDLNLQNDVALPGFASNPYSLIKNASVFVLSSLWEGLPTVLIEALACGVPIVSTDCPSGPREILDNGRLGSLVPVADHIALANAMMRRLNMGRANVQEEDIARFSRNKVLPAYAKLMQL